jgi:hypothetical protein
MMFAIFGFASFEIATSMVHPRTAQRSAYIMVEGSRETGFRETGTTGVHSKLMHLDLSYAVR